MPHRLIFCATLLSACTHGDDVDILPNESFTLTLHSASDARLYLTEVTAELDDGEHIDCSVVQDTDLDIVPWASCDVGTHALGSATVFVRAFRHPEQSFDITYHTDLCHHGASCEDRAQLDHSPCEGTAQVSVWLTARQLDGEVSAVTLDHEPCEHVEEQLWACGADMPGERTVSVERNGTWMHRTVDIPYDACHVQSIDVTM